MNKFFAFAFIAFCATMVNGQISIPLGGLGIPGYGIGAGAIPVGPIVPGIAEIGLPIASGAGWPYRLPATGASSSAASSASASSSGTNGIQTLNALNPWLNNGCGLNTGYPWLGNGLGLTGLGGMGYPYANPGLLAV